EEAPLFVAERLVRELALADARKELERPREALEVLVVPIERLRRARSALGVLDEAAGHRGRGLAVPVGDLATALLVRARPDGHDEHVVVADLAVRRDRRRDAHVLVGVGLGEGGERALRRRREAADRAEPRRVEVGRLRVLRGDLARAIELSAEARERREIASE